MNTTSTISTRKMTETTANYDKIWKEMIEEYFPIFINLFYLIIDQQINW